MKRNEKIEAVITSYNQGEYIREALDCVCSQTVIPAKIIVVDDGSTDEESKNVLEIISHGEYPTEVIIHRQENGGVSNARNNGISLTSAPYVLVMDGDDEIENTYIEKVMGLLCEDASMAAASSYMQCFGAISAVIKPDGGDIGNFLSHNCCPATHICRKALWEQCGGYDEKMRSGFEDWDFFLGLLETSEHIRIGIVEEPLLKYRTAPLSSNIRSMDKRIKLMQYLIGKHRKSYERNVEEALLGVERISMYRLEGWESEMKRAADTEQMGRLSKEFLEHPTYGDGGMAAAVRILGGR